MDLLQNIETIKNNKEVIVQAFDTYLDSAYNILQPMSDEHGVLIEEKVNALEEESKKFVIGLSKDLQNYEVTRMNIINDSFNKLEFADICYTISCLQFCSIQGERTINSMVKAKLAIDAIINDLASRKVDNESQT